MHRRWCGGLESSACGCTTNFSLATNEYRGANAGERTEYHSLVAWDRLAEVCGQFLGKGQLVDVEGQQIDRLLPVRWSKSDDAPFEP